MVWSSLLSPKISHGINTRHYFSVFNLTYYLCSDDIKQGVNQRYKKASNSRRLPLLAENGGSRSQATREREPIPSSQKLFHRVCTSEQLVLGSSCRAHPEAQGFAKGKDLLHPTHQQPLEIDRCASSCCNVTGRCLELSSCISGHNLTTRGLLHQQQKHSLL